MRLVGHVIGASTVGEKTRIVFETDKSDLQSILKLQSNRRAESEMLIDDNRQISLKQRAKIFACIKDFSLYTGYDAEYARQLFTLSFCYENGIEPFSLSNCSLETAREFINYLIDFCMDNDIPLSENAIERTDDINKYIYMCIKKGLCCCCQKQGVVYQLANGNKISLCVSHYDEARIKGLKEFERLYKVYPIRIKEE